MERTFESHVDKLKKLVLSMGGHVESALSVVIDGLNHKDQKKLASVHEIEVLINSEHKQVDSECVKFLAQQGPVAKDLRRLVSYIKINSDLERMGDQCVNISYTAKDFLERAVLAVPPEISKMSERTRIMVRDSLDAFVREDVELAKKVLLLDDEVDEMKNIVFDKMSAHIKAHPNAVEASLDMILIARNLERLGDHATNVAETVIFVSTGEDIRHGGSSS